LGELKTILIIYTHHEWLCMILSIYFPLFY
jgi:hypothetical protein